MKPFNKIGTILELGELLKTINPLGPVRSQRSLMAYLMAYLLMAYLLESIT